MPNIPFDTQKSSFPQTDSEASIPAQTEAEDLPTGKRRTGVPYIRRISGRCRGTSGISGFEKKQCRITHGF